MKDRQTEPKPLQFRIPLISPLLHCAAMTVVVFLRSSFGFAYFSPKSVFFGASWAFALFTVYAWMEKQEWMRFSLLCIYGVAAIGLYWLHLSIAFAKELREEGEHDHDSGTSHVLHILSALGKTPSGRFAMRWHIAGEPLVIVMAAAMLRVGFAERYLSFWLFIVAPCLCLKECLNYWFHIRQKKRNKDAFEDADSVLAHSAAEDAGRLIPSRIEKTRRPRQKE